MAGKVFVLGAGASFASKCMPLGHELVWQYEFQCGSAKMLDDGRPVMDDENRRFARYREFLELAERVYPELDGLVAKFDQRGATMFCPEPGERYHVDKMLLTLLKTHDAGGIDLVRQLASEHLLERERHGWPDTLYPTFISQALAPFRNETCVISFNFDCLVSDDFRSGTYFDYGLSFDWVEQAGLRRQRTNDPVPLLKLHGSLDWGECEDCGRMHLYSVYMNRDHYLNAVCQYCAGRIRPFIVMPHEGSPGKLSGIWSGAAEALKRAAEVVVIGYSFPTYDLDSRELLSATINPKCLLTVVDAPLEKETLSEARCRVELKYSDLVPGHLGQIQTVLTGFRGYLEGLGLTPSSLP